jgi:Tol biopolymer transport system component
LGVVFHEMLTGRRLFQGETVSDTLAEVLKTDIGFDALPAATPPAIRRLLRRCLERNPRNRLHDAADARIVIEEVLSGRADADAARPAGDAPARGRGTGWPARLGWLGSGIALGALAIALFGRALFVEPPVLPPSVRSLTYSGASGDASVSPDGRTVAFVSNRDGTPRIWLKQLATGEEVALTQGKDFGPRISPDASSVLFARTVDDGVDLFRVPLVGGEPRRLARDVASADWSPDGSRIAFARDEGRRSRLILIPADGGAEQVLVEREGFLDGVAWSPDGKRILVREGSRVNTASLRILATVDLPSGSYREWYRIPAGSVSSDPCWDGDDALLFAWSRTQAARGEIKLQRLALGAAAPQPLFSFTSLPQRIGLAGPGALVFDGGDAHQNLFDLAEGRTLGRSLTGGPTIDRQPAFSPDGRRVVFSSDRAGSLDLWSLELATGAVRRLTFDAADDWDPQWTPDGKHLLWSSNRSGHFEVWIAEPDGSGARQVTSDGVDAENPTMSLDGSWVVYSSSNPAAPGIWKIHPDGSGATRLLSGNFTLPELAPGSNWVAAVDGISPGEGVRRIPIVRLEDGAAVTDLFVPGRLGSIGRSRWMPDGRTLVSWGQDESRRTVLYRQPVAPGRDSRAQRELLVTSDERRTIESFGVSPVDGRIVVSAGWGESDVLIVEGIPGIGASWRAR